MCFLFKQCLKPRGSETLCSHLSATRSAIPLVCLHCSGGYLLVALLHKEQSYSQDTPAGHHSFLSKVCALLGECPPQWICSLPLLPHLY